AVALALALAPGCARQESAPAGNSPAASTTQANGSPTPSPRAADKWKPPPGIQDNVSVECCYAGDNSKQQYFLMRHRKPARPPVGYGLVVIVPGGPGPAEFLPFGANVLTAVAIPEDFLVAQLVAPQWRPGDDRVVWPSHVFPDDKAEFTTE